MANYSKRYYTDVLSQGLDNYTVEIEKLNYSGDTTRILAGDDLSIKFSGGRDNLLDTVFPSLGKFSFRVEEKYDNGNSGREEYQELLTSNYKDLRLSIYKNRVALDTLSNAFNINAGETWVLTGSTPYVVLNADDSKDLAVQFTGARINQANTFNYSVDVRTIGSGSPLDPPTVPSVSDYTQTGTNPFVRNLPYNTYWVSTVPSGQASASMIVPITNGISGVSYTYLTRYDIANVSTPYPLQNTITYTLYAADHTTIIDQVVHAYYYGNKSFTGNILFEPSGHLVPAFIDISCTIVSNDYGSIGNFILYDRETQYYTPAYQQMGVLTASGSSALHTSGNLNLKYLDDTFNTITSEVIGTFTGDTTLVGQATLNSSIVPSYLALEAVADSGSDTTVVRINRLDKVGSENGYLYWRGWIDPSLITTKYINPGNYLVSVDSKDGLLDLKDIPFTESATTSTFYNNLGQIKEALINTGLDLPIHVQVNWSNETVSGATISGDTIYQTFSNGARYYDIKNGKKTIIKSTTAIDYILRFTNSYIIQREGAWQIVQRNEEFSPNHLHKWDDLSIVNSDLRDRVLNLVELETDQPVLDSDELSMVEPYKTSLVNIINAPTEDNALPFGDISSGSTGWNNSTGTTAFNDFFTSQNYINVTNRTPPAPSQDKYFQSNIPFAVLTTTADTLTFTFDAKCEAFSSSGVPASSNPYYRINLIDATTMQPWYVDQGYLQPGGWKTYTNKVKVAHTGSTLVRVWVIVNSNSYFLTSTYFDNFNLSTKFQNTDIFSQYVSAENVNSTAIANFETDQYFYDSFLYTEKSTIKSSVTGSTQSGWFNYSRDNVSGLSVTQLYTKEIMDQYSRFKEYVRFNLRSLTKDVWLDSILQVRGKKYYVGDLTKNLLSNVSSLQLVERIEDVEANLVYVTGNYATSGPVSSSSSSSNGGGSGSGNGSEATVYYPGSNITIVDNIISAIIPDAFTGGTSGITNTSLTNELPKTNASSDLVSSGIFSTALGNLNLGGSTTTGSTRTVQAAGSSSNIGIAITPKGNGSMSLNSETFINGLNNAGTKGFVYSMGRTSLQLAGKGLLEAVSSNRMTVKGGDGGTTGGDVVLKGGTGSTTPGKIILDSNSGIQLGDTGTTVNQQQISSVGTPTNIPIIVAPKGTGHFQVSLNGRTFYHSGNTTSAIIRLLDNGSIGGNGYDLTLKGSSSIANSGNGRAGDLILQAGLPRIGGSGRFGRINLNTLAGLIIADYFPTADPSVTGALYTDAQGKVYASGYGTPSTQIVFQDTVTITSAEVLTSNSSPKTIIAAPGSGKVINVLSIMARLPYNSTTYATNVSGNFRYTNTAGTIINSAAMNIAQTVDKVFRLALQSSPTGDATSTMSNQPVVFAVNSGNPTAGDSDIMVYITYQIITL